MDGMLHNVEHQTNHILQIVQGMRKFIKEESLYQYPEIRPTYFFGCIQILFSNPNVLALNFGFHDGTFFSISSLQNTEIRNHFNAPEDSTYCIWAVTTNEDGELVEWWEYLDAGLNPISIQKKSVSYDPRSRSWYIDAMLKDDLTLTDPYIFTTSRVLGMTCTAPMKHGRGVVSTNITLQNFQNLFHNVELSPNGQAFLLDNQYNTISGIINKDGESHFLDTDKLLTLEEHEVFTTKKFVELLHHRSEKIQPTDIDGEKHFFLCKDFKIGDKVLTLLTTAPVSDFTEFAELHQERIFYYGFLTLLLMVPVSIFFSYRLIRPLRDLQKHALSLKKDKATYGKPLKSHIFEVQRLSNTLHSMYGSIRRRTKELLEIQKKQEELVIERTAELAHARDLAEQATQTKSAFLSTVTHEMRTPLNAIIGFVHLFERDGLRELQKNYLDKIRLSSEQLLHIINDVLDFSKIEAGKMDIETIPFHTRALVDTVLSVVSLSALKKHLELKAELDDAVPDKLMGDPSRLRQILLNLLNNAIKFTSSGKITLRMQVDRDFGEHPENITPLYFSVSDSGTGIEPHHLQRIFQPFSQADTSISRRYGGTGLGLSICRHLIGLMGGHIQVTSTVGRGTTFFFTIPMTQITDEDMKKNDAEGIQPLPRSCQSARILVVDDDEINREIACALLEAEGLTCLDTAMDGADAIQKIKCSQYDLVFMDVQMPVMDGLEATRSIRAIAAENDRDSALSALSFDKLPIVAMTGNAMTSDVKECLEAGMNDHIAKPILPEVLHTVLLHWLQKKTH